MEYLASGCFVEGSGLKCEDRAEVFIREPVVVGVVADGAGGTAGGAAAANLVVEEVRLAFELGSNLLDPIVCKTAAARMRGEARGRSHRTSHGSDSCDESQGNSWRECR